MEIKSLRLKFPKPNPQQERNKKCSNSMQQKTQQHNLENATMLTTKMQQRNPQQKRSNALTTVRILSL